MPNHTVIYGSGTQTIALVPERVPTSATVAIADPRYSESSTDYVVVPADTAATVDSTSTTLAAACGRGADRRLVSLASIAGIVIGRSYELADERGQREVIVVDSINAGAKTVYTRDPILKSYALGSTFRGAEVRASVPATWCDSEEVLRGGMQAIITWTLVGVTTGIIRQSIALDRGTQQLVTPQDVLLACPSLAQGRAGRADLTTAIAQATAHYFSDLRMAGISPSSHFAGQLGQEAVKVLAVMYALQHSNDESDVRVWEWAKDRSAEIRAALAVGKDKSGVVELDPNSDSAKSPNIRSLLRIDW